MRIGILVCLVAVLVAPAMVDSWAMTKRDILTSFFGFSKMPTPPTPRRPNGPRFVSSGSIEQPIDHFDPNNEEIFQQQFFSNYEHFVGSGSPIFVLVGGEYPIYPEWLEGGHFFDLAEEHGAAMFYLEHRFYGNSFPRDRNADLETLQYFTPAQAVADLDFFIDRITDGIPQFLNAEVFVVGASLGGSLVTWHQADYSGEVVGAWASSAPLEAIVDFVEAKEVTSSVLRRMGGQQCFNRIRNGFRDLEQLFDDGNYARIREVMNLCPGTNIESNHGRWVMLQLLSAEYIIFAAIGDAQLFEAGCTLLSLGATDLDALGLLHSVILDDQCLEFDYETIVQYLSVEEWSDEWSLELRLISYTGCKELGWFPTTSSPHQIFGSPEAVPIQLLYDMCMEVFDITPEEIHAGVEATNERFGALNPTISRIITTQGMNDPFRPLGLQYDFSEDAIVHLIPGAGHSADFYSYSGEDSDAVRAAKRLIADTVRDWFHHGHTKKA